MKTVLYEKISIWLIFSLFLLSCEDFLEVEAPDHKIVNEAVFTNDQTALSTMTGIYNELFRASYIGGGGSSVTALGALSADELKVLAQKYCPTKIATTYDEAIQKVAEDEVIFVFGSLYLASAIRPKLKNFFKA